MCLMHLPEATLLQAWLCKLTSIAANAAELEAGEAISNLQCSGMNRLRMSARGIALGFKASCRSRTPSP